MKKTPFVLFIALLLACLFSGCASVSTLQVPGTVPKGEVRYGLNVSATGGTGDADSSTDPNFEASFRWGIVDHFDLGLKINLLGAQIGAKYQFLEGNFDLALGLELGYQYVLVGGTEDPKTHLLAAQLPLLMEYHFNEYVGLAFGPKFLGVYAIQVEVRDDKDEIIPRTDIWGKSGFYAGFMLGLPLRLVHGMWIMPEINFYTSVVDEDKNIFNNFLWQAGVSVYFGSVN